MFVQHNRHLLQSIAEFICLHQILQVHVLKFTMVSAHQIVSLATDAQIIYHMCVHYVNKLMVT